MKKILLSIIIFITVVINFGCIREQKGIGLNYSVEYFGIKILSLRLSAEGHMIDLRYRVIDPEKAKPFFDSRIKPYLIDLKSGAKFLIPDPPKIGSLRQMPKFPESKKDYFILFANPGRYLKKGDRVSIVIGDFRIDDIIIE